MARPPPPNALKSPTQPAGNPSGFNDPSLGWRPIQSNSAGGYGGVMRQQVNNGPAPAAPLLPTWMDAHAAWKIALGHPATAVGDLLDLIGRSEVENSDESRRFASGYDVPLGYGRYGLPPKPLSQMPIGDVKKFQDEIFSHPNNHQNSSAVGRFQVEHGALREAQRELGLNDSDVFDSNVQTAVGGSRLRFRGLDKYMRGELPLEDFQDGLAREWSSLPDRSGKSHYPHTAVGVSGPELQAAIAKLRGADEGFSIRTRTVGDGAGLGGGAGRGGP